MFILFFLVFIFFDTSSPESLDTVNIHINLDKGKSIPSVTSDAGERFKKKDNYEDYVNKKHEKYDSNGENKNGPDDYNWYESSDWTKSKTSYPEYRSSKYAGFSAYIPEPGNLPGIGAGEGAGFGATTNSEPGNLPGIGADGGAVFGAATNSGPGVQNGVRAGKGVGVGWMASGVKDGAWLGHGAGLQTVTNAGPGVRTGVRAGKGVGFGWITPGVKDGAWLGDGAGLEIDTNAEPGVRTGVRAGNGVGVGWIARGVKDGAWLGNGAGLETDTDTGQSFTTGGQMVRTFQQGIQGVYMMLNAESLSANMVSNLLQAMAKVRNTPDFGQIASTHGEPVRKECNFLFCCVHQDDGGFLPWHRLILIAMNQALMKHNSIVGFPYWDWTTSLFPSLALHPHITDPKTGQKGENPFFRGLLHFNNTFTIRNRALEPLKENFQRVLSALQEDDFRSFSAQFRQVHAFVHQRTGGNMGDLGTSAFDPVFYMHHSFVDLIWAVYQKLKPNSPFPNHLLKSIMNPFGISVAQTLDYQKNFGYHFNLDINSNRIVFGGMTLAQIQSRISRNPTTVFESGGKLKDKIYAGIFLQSYQTSGKILFNCCDMENCSYSCGYAAIFGGSKERPFIDTDATKFEVTKAVEIARIPLKNLRFKITRFEDLEGNKLSKNVYQPINIIRPGDMGKDIYIIYFNRNYNLPPKIRVPETCTFKIESPYKNVIQTQNENNFINCNLANEASFVPAGKILDIDPGNYYFYDNDCVSQSIYESFGSGSYNGSRINIIKE